MSGIRIHPEVCSVLSASGPVVALETAVLTHGLPRTAIVVDPMIHDGKWNPTQPANLELVRLLARTVRKAGATPAVIGVRQGQLIIGLTDEELVDLASDETARKVSVSNLAAALASGPGEGRSGGTTVAATLVACRQTDPPIRVFATGGIGGLHRNWTTHPDISADLAQLATTPTCVVCSGVKSILDVSATREALETLGIPLVGYQTDSLASFVCGSHPLVQCSSRCDSPAELAKLCLSHWEELALRSGVVVAAPVSPDWELSEAEFEQATTEAEAEAAAARMTGSDRTPFLLRRIADLTQNRSLFANLALLRQNADLAARLAIAITDSTH